MGDRRPGHLAKYGLPHSWAQFTIFPRAKYIIPSPKDSPVYGASLKSSVSPPNQVLGAGEFPQMGLWVQSLGCFSSGSKDP